MEKKSEEEENEQTEFVVCESGDLHKIASPFLPQKCESR